MISESDAKPYVLGLDLGVQSIGWAILDLDDGGRPCAIRRAGVRCFDSGTGSETEIQMGKDESNNAKRRDARQHRRQLFRRAQRLKRVLRALQRAGLMPEGSLKSAARHEMILKLDRELAAQYAPEGDRAASHVVPYLLRAKALDEPLAPNALGRALFHLAQRRGFLSNKKARKEKDEEGVVKAGISQLHTEIQQAGARTLGEFYAGLDPEDRRIRGRWTGRQMFLDEFEQIWAAQSPHHPGLTNDMKNSIHHAIFFQRPLKSQKGLVGRCELEPHHHRAPMATLLAQRFRYLQKLNDLEITAPDGEIRALSPEQKDRLRAALESGGDLTFAQLRNKKLLDLKKPTEKTSGFEINLESGGEKKIPGNRTAEKFIKVLGDRWQEMPGERRDRLVQEVLQSEHEDELSRRLEANFGFPSVTSAQLSAIELEQGYCALSRRAMRRLLPGLEAGRRLNDVRKEIYGEQLLRGGPDCERLPAVGKVAASLRNPVVCRALSELRKVVNAIVRQYGKPEKVRIELARDMKKGRKLREETWKDMRKNEKLRENARRKILDEVGISDPRPGDVLKMLLADECNWECPYTGRPITPRSLLGDSPQFDIEHIIPFSRSLDNSFANKTLCYHEENRNVKQNRTPWEAYSCDDKRWAEIIARVRRFHGGAAAAKLRRFQLQEIPEGFVQQQLNDTRYISRMAADYVGLLFGGRVDAERTQRVQVGRGGMTKYLRDEWNLNRILSDGDVKNRNDHRHHAVDAVVIALTGPATVQTLSRSAEQAHDMGRRLFVPIDAPWGEAAGFLDEIRGAIEAVNVSYRVNRRIGGALHEDSNYSKPHPVASENGKKVVAYRHIRKPLERMSAREIEAIVDDRVRDRVKAHLEANGGDLKKAFGDSNNHPYLKARDGRVIPIHKARIRKNEATIAVGAAERQRYVSTGSNHHIEIVASLDEKGNETGCEFHIVSLYEAARRVRAREPVVRREHGKDTKFKFSMAKNEYFVMDIEPGEAALYRVVKISANDIEFQLHCDGRPTMVDGRKRVRIHSPRALQGVKARKVAVDPLGNILPAHD